MVPQTQANRVIISRRVMEPSGKGNRRIRISVKTTTTPKKMSAPQRGMSRGKMTNPKSHSTQLPG
jgi:hypothetical protein